MHAKTPPPDQLKDPDPLYQPDMPLDWNGRPREPLSASFRPLPFGSIRPSGWLQAQLLHDLQHGFAGKLDQLVPDTFEDDVFGADRRTRLKDSGETGSSWTDEEVWAELEMKWWNAEVQGNWWDGFIRTALLTGDTDAIATVENLVQRLLATRDEDGYLGIYGKDLRFQHSGENGELWALAVLGRGLLAWAQARQDKEALNAVIRAVDRCMTESLRADYHLFAVKNPWAGVTHNLMLSDVLVTLHHMTGEERYQTYALNLFRQFAEHPSRYDDICPSRLADSERPFYQHGAHTYEHLRVLLNAWRQTGYPELAAAWESALKKLAPCIAPSGAGIGFEHICGAEAHPQETASEMCSILELQNSLIEALFALGTPEFGDQVERIAYNAAPGQRSPDAKGLCYLRTDTAYAIEGHEPDGTPNPRYKLSPAHQDCAICCAPNSVRALPYYVMSMAALTPEGIVILLHGPCRIKTAWKGVEVTIEVETRYPFEDCLRIRVHCSQAVEFTLSVRVPAGACSPESNLPGTLRDGYLQLHQSWKHECVEVDFHFKPEWKQTLQGDAYAMWGNLVFARPVEGRFLPIKDFPIPGFHDYHVRTMESDPVRTWQPSAPLVLMQCPSETNSQPNWDHPGIALETSLLKNESPVKTTLVPMASSVLRQVHFQNS
jgi:DUF1680 family protein